MFKNPLVVGHKGEIGKFIIHRLLDIMPKADNILCVDIKNSRKEVIDRIKKSDIIFLCVPIEYTGCWLDEFHKFLKNKLVVEQTSIKEWISRLHYDRGEFNLISMHLLFKPSATLPADMRWAIIDTSQNPKSKWGEILDLVTEITYGGQCNIYDDIEAHDRDMATQQALLHRVILSIDELLGDFGRTYIGLKIGELATRIKSMNPILFDRIQNNKYIPEVIEKFEKEIKNAKTLTKRPKISKKDRRF